VESEDSRQAMRKGFEARNTWAYPYPAVEEQMHTHLPTSCALDQGYWHEEPFASHSRTKQLNLTKSLGMRPEPPDVVEALAESLKRDAESQPFAV